MRTVDKLDKIGAEKVKALLLEQAGCRSKQAGEILDFIAITGDNAAGPGRPGGLSWPERDV